MEVEVVVVTMAVVTAVPEAVTPVVSEVLMAVAPLVVVLLQVSNTFQGGKMKPVFLVLIIVLTVVCLGVAIVGGAYNGLVSSSNNVENQWANVQSAYQRRLDLVNQTLPAVIGGSQQELAVFKILRDQAAALAGAFNQNGQTTVPQGADAQKLQQQIANFDKAWVNALVYTADNPDINSTQLYSDFMVQVEGSENRINVARRDYNTSVTAYRNKVQMFPGNIIANIFGFDANRFAFFEASEEAQDAPTVVFPTPQP